MTPSAWAPSGTVRAQTKNRQIELGRELKDEDVVEVLSRIAKQHRESIEQFAGGGRDELVEHERGQLAVVEEYLPEQLGEQELAEIAGRRDRRNGRFRPP